MKSSKIECPDHAGQRLAARLDEPVRPARAYTHFTEC